MAYETVCSWKVDAYGNLARTCTQVWKPDPLPSYNQQATSNVNYQQPAVAPTVAAPKPVATVSAAVQKQQLAYQARVRAQREAAALAARRAYIQAQQRARLLLEDQASQRAMREAEQRRQELLRIERRRREQELAARRRQAYESLQSRLRNARLQAQKRAQQGVTLEEETKKVQQRVGEQRAANTQRQESLAASLEYADSSPMWRGKGTAGDFRRNRMLEAAELDGDYARIFEWIRDSSKRTGGRYLDQKLYETAMQAYNEQVNEVSTAWGDLLRQINDLGAKGDWRAAQTLLDSEKYRDLEARVAKLKGDGRKPGEIERVAQLSQQIAESRDAYLERVFLGMYAGRGRDLAMPTEVRLWRERFQREFGDASEEVRNNPLFSGEPGVQGMTLRKWAELQFDIQERASQRWSEMSMAERYRAIGLRFTPRIGWTITSTGPDGKPVQWVLKPGAKPMKGDQINPEAFEVPGASSRQAHISEVLRGSGYSLADVAELANKMEGDSYIGRAAAQRELVQLIEKAVDNYYRREGLDRVRTGAPSDPMSFSRWNPGPDLAAQMKARRDVREELTVQLLSYLGVERPGGIVGGIDKISRAPVLGQLLGGLDLFRSGVWAGLWDARVALKGRESLGTVELPTVYFENGRMYIGQEDAETGKNRSLDLTQAWDYSNQDEIQAMYDEYRRVMDNPNSTMEERAQAVLMIGSMGRTGNSMLLFDAATDPLNFLAVGRFLRAGNLALGEAGGLRNALTQFKPGNLTKFKMPGIAPVLKDYGKFVTPEWFGPNGALRVAETTKAQVYANLAKAMGVTPADARQLPLNEVQDMLKRLAKGQDIDEVRGALPGVDRFLEGRRVNTQQLTAFAEAEVIRQQGAVIHPRLIRNMVDDAIKEQDAAEEALRELTEITSANTARLAGGRALQELREQMAAQGIEPMVQMPVTPGLKGGHVAKLNRLRRAVEAAMAERVALARKTAEVARRIQNKETLDVGFRQIEYRKLEEGLRDLERYRDLTENVKGQIVIRRGIVGQAQESLRSYRRSLGLTPDERPTYGRWFAERWAVDQKYLVNQMRFARRMRDAATTDTQRRIWQGKMGKLYAAIDGLRLERELSEGGTGVAKRIMRSHGREATARFSPNQIARPILSEQGAVEETVRQMYARLTNSEVQGGDMWDATEAAEIARVLSVAHTRPRKTTLKSPELKNLEADLGQRMTLGESIDVVRGLMLAPGGYDWWQDTYESLINELRRGAGLNEGVIENYLDFGHTNPNAAVLTLETYREIDRAVQTAIRTAKKGARRKGATRAMSGGGEQTVPGVILDNDPLTLLVKSRVLREKGFTLQQYDEARTMLGDISRRDLVQRSFFKRAKGSIEEFLRLREARRSREAFNDLEEYANRADRVGMTDEEIWSLWNAEHALGDYAPQVRLITPYQQRVLRASFEDLAHFSPDEHHLVARLLGGHDELPVGAERPTAGQFGGLLDSIRNLPAFVVDRMHPKLTPQGAFKGFPRLTPDDAAAKVPVPKGYTRVFHYTSEGRAQDLKAGKEMRGESPQRAGNRPLLGDGLYLTRDGGFWADDIRGGYVDELDLHEVAVDMPDNLNLFVADSAEELARLVEHYGLDDPQFARGRISERTGLPMEQGWLVDDWGPKLREKLLADGFDGLEIRNYDSSWQSTYYHFYDITDNQIVLYKRGLAQPVDSPPFRVVVGGDKNFADTAFLEARLNELKAKHPNLMIVTGGGRGVDQYAEAWAIRNGVKTERQVADWANEGRKAGGKRNEKMMRSDIQGVVIFEPGDGDRVVSPIGTSLKRAADAAKVPIWKPKGSPFSKIGERQLVEEASTLRAALPEMRRLAGLEFQISVPRGWSDTALTQLDTYLAKVQRTGNSVQVAQVERAIRVVREMQSRGDRVWVSLGKLGRFEEIFDEADVPLPADAMKSRKIRRATGSTFQRGWPSRWKKADESADRDGSWARKVARAEARLDEIDETLNGPKTRHREFRGLTISNDGIYIAKNADAVTVAHELFHAYWDDPANVVMKRDVEAAIDGLGMASRTEIWQQIRIGRQGYDNAEMAAELYGLWRMGDDAGSGVRVSWRELLDSQDPVTRFQLEVLGERFKDLGTLSDRWGFGLNHPPFGNRAKMRQWLVDNGFWSPKTAEEIRTGARIWSIEDERRFWETNYAYTPPWTDPEVLRPLLESPEEYFKQFRKWGFFDDDFDQLAAGHQMKALSAGDRMVFGSEGIKAARSFEEMREWFIARYGELVSEDGRTLTSVPWLMNFEEYSLWFGRQLVSDDNLKTLGLTLDQTLVGPTELGTLAKVTREAVARHLERFKAKLEREGLDPELWLPEERKRLAYDIVDELLGDKSWMGIFDRAGLVERSQLIGQMQRLFIVWTPAFPIMNAIDSFGPKAALLSIMKNRGRWIFHTENRWDEWVPDLATVGDDLVPTWGHARMNPWLKLGDERYNAREQLGAFSQGIAEAPLRLSAKAEGVLRLNFARSVAGRTIDDLVKTGMDLDTAILFGRYEAHKALKTFFSVLDHAPAWEKILNQIVPFFTYTYKNALMGLRIIVEAPWLASLGQRLGMYIDGMNRRNWEEAHPGEAFPEQFDSERLWIQSPSGTTYTLDLGMFSDWTRAMKGLGERDLFGANGFLRIPHPWQTAILGLFTGQETAWGAEAGIENISPWFEFFEWAFGDQEFNANDPKSKDVAQIVSQMLFFKAFGRIPPVSSKIQTFFGLMELDEARAWEYYEANPDIEAYFQLDGVRPRGLFDTRKWSWHSFASDEEIAAYNKAMSGLDALNEAFDQVVEAYYMQPWSRELRQLKLERRAAVAAFIRENPILEEAWMWTRASNWAPEGLEGFATDLLIEDFFSIPRPNKADFDTELAFQEATLEYLDARERFLEQNPSVYDALYAGQNAVERAWHEHELQWSEILRDQAQIRIQIAKEEAKSEPNRDKLDVLYRISDANYALLDQESFGEFYDQLGVDLVDNQPSFVRALLNRGLGRVQQKVAFPGRADFFYEIADDRERLAIVEDEKYFTALGDLMSELKQKDDFSTFWSELKGRGLLNRYLKENPNKRPDYEYSMAISRIFAAGEPIKFWDRLMAEPRWLNEYLTRNPEKRATYDRILVGKRYYNEMQALWGVIGDDFSRFYDELAKRPWLQQQYFARNPEKVGRGGSGGMSAYGIAISAIYQKAKDGKEFYELLRQNPALMAEYFRRHPDRAATYRAGQEYFSYISRWVEALKRDDFVGAQDLWNAMPAWVHERYLARHPDSAMARRGALQSSDYSGYLGRWVELLREEKYVEADEYFRSMPSWVQERYFTNHPDQRAKHQLTSDMLRAGAEYFLAPSEDLKLGILQKYPQLGAWLKEHGGDEGSWRGLIFAIYRAIPSSDGWLKRKFRQSYPELFGPEAVGERRIKRVLAQLARNPEMLPFYEKAFALQFQTYTEQLKFQKAPPKPLTMERKSRLLKRRKRRAARLHSRWSTHQRLRRQ